MVDGEDLLVRLQVSFGRGAAAVATGLRWRWNNGRKGDPLRPYSFHPCGGRCRFKGEAGAVAGDG
jgi:hypothetical protein